MAMCPRIGLKAMPPPPRRGKERRERLLCGAGNTGDFAAAEVDGAPWVRLAGWWSSGVSCLACVWRLDLFRWENGVIVTLHKWIVIMHQV